HCKLPTLMSRAPAVTATVFPITSAPRKLGAKPTKIALSAGCCALKVCRWKFRVSTAFATYLKAAIPAARLTRACLVGFAALSLVSKGEWRTMSALHFWVFSYNRAEFLSNCVASIELCAPGWPIHIFDDHSSDPETRAVLAELALRHQVVYPTPQAHEQ